MVPIETPKSRQGPGLGSTASHGVPDVVSLANLSPLVTGYTSLCFNRIKTFAHLNYFLRKSKDDSNYLAFKVITLLYSKFVYHSTFFCEAVLLGSQLIQICCMTITNMHLRLRYVHLYIE